MLSGSFPSPGFQAAVAQLTEEHIKELLVLHAELAQLKGTAREQPADSTTRPGFATLRSPLKPIAQTVGAEIADWNNTATEQSANVSTPKPGLAPLVSTAKPLVQPLVGSGIDEPDPLEALEAGSDDQCASRELFARAIPSQNEAQINSPVSPSHIGLNHPKSDSDSNAEEVDPRWLEASVDPRWLEASQPLRETLIGQGSKAICISNKDCPLFEARPIWGGARDEQSPRLDRLSATSHLSSISSETEFRQESQYPFIFGPASTTHGFWVSLTTTALAYDLFLIPMMLAFDLPQVSIVQIGNWITRFVWTIDIPMNFLTAYYDATADAVIDSPCRIAGKYIKSWFSLDFALVFIDWYLSMSGGDNKVSRVGRLGKFARFLRFLRMLRLLRAARFASFFEQLIETVVDEAVRLRFITLKIVLMMLWLNHFIACMWYTVGSMEVNGNLGWALTYPGLNGVAETYSASLQWALTNFGVGSTRLSPSTAAENIFAFVTMLCALLIFATLLSTIANGYARMQALRNDELVNMVQLRTYLAQNEVPNELRDRIIVHSKRTVRLQKSKMKADSVALLKQLSPRMNAELLFVVYQKHIELSVLFSRLLQKSKHLMFTMANEAMASMQTPGGDVLFYRGQTANEMLLVPIDGFLGHITYTGTLRSKGIPAGRWMCEVCLWVQWVHLGSLHVSDACEQVHMTADKFIKVVSDHPDIFGAVQDLSMRFVASLNQALARHTDEDIVEHRIDTLELYDTHAYFDDRGTNSVMSNVWQAVESRRRVEHTSIRISSPL